MAASNEFIEQNTNNVDIKKTKQMKWFFKSYVNKDARLIEN